jgi:hypothetical protein
MKSLQKLLSIIIILILFSSIKTQDTISEEKQLYNNNLIKFNKTEIQYKEISEKMKNIKYNIFLKIRYKNLKKKHQKIEIKLGKIKEKLDSNNYDKNELKEEIKEIYESITKFEKKCNKALDIFYKSEKTKKVLMNMIKAFFWTLLVIIIVVLIVIGVASIFIIKRQRKYYALEEENSQVNIINEGKNNLFDKIKEKIGINGDSSSRELNKRKKGKKTKKKAKKHKNENIDDIKTNEDIVSNESNENNVNNENKENKEANENKESNENNENNENKENNENN